MDDLKECLKPTNEALIAIINKSLSENPTEEPFFVADLSDVVKKYRAWTSLLPRVHPFYAVKVNSDFLFLQFMVSLGLSFDCASKKEIEMVLAAGAKPSDIIFAHPFKLSSSLRYAKSRNVNFLTFDSQGELLKIKESHPSAKLLIRFQVPNSLSYFSTNEKFGCEMKECRPLLKVAKCLGLDVIGTCFHVGSLCSDPAAFSKAIMMSHEVFDIARDLGYHFSVLDIGGGFPGEEDCYEDFSIICANINKSLQKYFPEDSNVQIIAEPGYYFACSSFILCTTIIGKKIISKEENEQGTVNVSYYLNDSNLGSFNELNVSLYGKNLKPLLTSSEVRCRDLLRSTLWGCTCNSVDCIMDKCLLPEMEIGERIICENHGAYSLCLASNFNGFPKPTVRYFYKKSRKEHMKKSYIEGSSYCTLSTSDWESFLKSKQLIYDECKEGSGNDSSRFGWTPAICS